MTSQSQPTEFVIDPSPTLIEWLRLIGPLLTEGTGGLFAERDDRLLGIKRILDLGCGPGDWPLSVAQRYQDVAVIGIDTSEEVIEEATSHARVRGLENAHFQIGDATQPLDFDDASFDLVNARTIVGFMKPELWPPVLAEIRRVLRPGGTFRITEFSEGLTNSAAAGKFWGLYAKALQAEGRSFDPEGRHIGLINMLPFLLRKAGFTNVDKKGHFIDHSADTLVWEGWYQNYSIVYRLLKPFIIRAGVMDEAQFNALYQQFEGEFRAADFTAQEPYLTVWGVNP
jgi:ubiquinone/menaquinone biosynthesis C-methylase UbiE